MPTIPTDRNPELDGHCKQVIQELTEGVVVPFLGAGVNLCGRPASRKWTGGESSYLPDGRELARYLAGATQFRSQTQVECKCGEKVIVETDPDLTRMAQRVINELGSVRLYRKLREVFDRNYEPTALHMLLAELPRRLAEKGYARYPLIIVTTNFDDLMERAFELQDPPQPYDVVKYLAKRKDDDAASEKGRGIFWHRPWAKEERAIVRANSYLDVPTDLPVILKIHGDIDRKSPEGDGDSYVVAEDNYIDYLQHSDVQRLLPVNLVKRMIGSHFLFLGYALRDWNCRIFLKRIWDKAPGSTTSWAVQKEPDETDKRYWERHSVQILDYDLADYVEHLNEALKKLPPQ